MLPTIVKEVLANSEVHHTDCQLTRISVRQILFITYSHIGVTGIRI